MSKSVMSCSVLLLILLVLFPAVGRGELLPPEDFQAFDMPNDAGRSVGLTWKARPGEDASLRYRVRMAEREGGPYRSVAEFPANSRYASDLDSPWWVWTRTRDLHFSRVTSRPDLPIQDGRLYFFTVAITDGRQEVVSPVRSAVPSPNLFNWAKLNNLVLLVLLAFFVLLSIASARRNPHIFLRKIPGLEAVEEAIGRATEMGRPILYLTGSDDMSSLSTIAATVILGEVTKRVASYDSRLIVPHRDPIVMAVCQEIMKESYLAAGRPDAYREDSNFFITQDQFSYSAAVGGIMMRERPASVFFMGYYYAESLLLAEMGAGTGAIQIAGTDAELQIPFFITTCDYTLIGEELYAASAYLSREPILVGTLRGQDIGKAVLVFLLLLGTVLSTVGGESVSPFLQFLRDFR